MTNSPSPAPILDVVNIEVVYNAIALVLKGVSLNVPKGGVVALLGANGAGKTTLLNTLSQIVRPVSGSIRFAGRDLSRARPEEVVEAGIIHVPQGRRLFAGLTVKENLLQGTYLRKDRSEIEKDLARVFRLLPRLAERADQPAGQLSGGEQQMCAIGRGLMGRPRLLLIDELSLGLAPMTVDRLMGMVRRINESGATVILVEQSLNRALSLADRCFFMERGEIRFEGPTTELMARDDLLRPVFLGTASSGLG